MTVLQTQIFRFESKQPPKRIQKGENLMQKEIIIEGAVKKIARLSPIGRKISRPTGRLDFRKAAGLGKEIWQDVDVDNYLQKERDQWA